LMKSKARAKNIIKRMNVTFQTGLDIKYCSYM
jgi:hypothetical protein